MAKKREMVGGERKEGTERREERRGIEKERRERKNEGERERGEKERETETEIKCVSVGGVG